MPVTEGHLTTPDGVRLFYRTVNNGPGAVLIPNAAHMFDSFSDLQVEHRLIFFDLQNRGGSDAVPDRSKLSNGIHHDVEDLEAVRLHFAIPKVDVIGHSYLGLSAILYALKHPDRVRRVVQIGAVQSNSSTTYPAEWTWADETLAAFPAKAAQVRSGAEFWSLIKTLMVFEPADANKIPGRPLDYPNELAFMRQWTEYTFPSIQRLQLTREDFAKVTAQVLTIHGNRDRQSPYGAGREWAALLPDARLLTVDRAAHVPWIEAPELVFGAIQSFLNGRWPGGAVKIGPAT